jgi:hypothetical protein
LKKHTEIYFKYFTEYRCECCEAYGQRMDTILLDVHHIENRGSGGSKTKDFIENLMGVCRKCHERYGEKDKWMAWLYRVHKQKLEANGKAFDVELIDSLIEKYAN